MGVQRSAVENWEYGYRSSVRANHWAQIIWHAYLKPDPVNGWRRAALGLAPDAPLPKNLPVHLQDKRRGGQKPKPNAWFFEI
jgi:hypothetical protein